jgi:hypothetical protein
MSELGQNPNASRTLVCQLPPAADIRRIGSGPLRATTGLVHRSKTALLNHFVGKGKKFVGNIEPDRLCGLEIEH